MKFKNKKIEDKLRVILKKIFKTEKKFYSMEKTLNWDSLNHLRLVLELERKFNIKIKNLEISKMTDQKKILQLIIRKSKNDR